MSCMFDENNKEEKRLSYPHYFETENFQRKKLAVEKIEREQELKAILLPCSLIKTRNLKWIVLNVKKY